MDEKIITEIFTHVKHDMKAGNVLWEDLIGTGFRYVSAIRAAISAHSAFLDALNKVALFANQSKGGCDDLGTLLCRLVDQEKNIDMMKASSVTHLNDGVLAPLEERVSEWRKMAQNDAQLGTPKRSMSESMKNLRKGASSENLFNRAAMTLSRRSRRGSSSRDGKNREPQNGVESPIYVSKENLTDILVENRARITTFVRSLQPYYAANIEHGQKTAQLTSEIGTMATLSHIKTSQIQNWVESQLSLYREGNMESPMHPNLTRHTRKSSVSSVNSVSSSKSDSCSSGSMRLSEPPIMEQNPNLRNSLLKIPSDVSQYRLSSTSHDSGFTSHVNGDHPQNFDHQNSQDDFSRNRTPSWKDWPKPGPYDSERARSTMHIPDHSADFELPPPPPELLNENFTKLEISTTDENGMEASFQSPDRSSRSNSSLASVPLSPYMKKPSPLATQFDEYQNGHISGRAIESGLATIRRKPSQSPLRRLNGPVSAPIPPVAPMPGTIPVRVPVPSPLCLSAKPPPPPVPISARPPLPNKPKRNGSTLSHEFQS